MSWKCKSCGTVNTDMTQFCSNCRADINSPGCLVKTIILILAGTVLAFAANEYKKMGKNKGGPRPIQINVDQDEKKKRTKP